MIMFAPDGRVDWVSNAGNPAGQAVISPIYLLVGSRQNVFNQATDPNYAADVANCNLNNISNLWVAINASTGMTFVTDMAAAGTTGATAAQYANSALWQSRAFARQSSVMGGK